MIESKTFGAILDDNIRERQILAERDAQQVTLWKTWLQNFQDQRAMKPTEQTFRVEGVDELDVESPIYAEGIAYIKQAGFTASIEEKSCDRNGYKNLLIKRD